MTTPQLVIASANPDKAAEIRVILGASLGNVELLARPTEVPDVEETGSTYVENARLKAVALLKATGVAAVADDSGLEVDALGGAPGVYSARYAGENATYEDNVEKLLRALQGAPSRRARFISVVLVRFPSGEELVAEGVVEGEIAHAPHGHGGFGYDPVFIPDDGGGLTYSELDAEAKHRLSHRGIALRDLAQLIVNRSPDEPRGDAR